MNFVFIIDTSLSMAQTFDSISYLDIAKSNIRKFIFEREINNYQLKKPKFDKYFLLTFSKILDEKFFIQNWSINTDQFLFQLNALKISYDTSSIETAVQNGFKLLNYIKKIGYEKHVYGHLFNKIQNSIIILITDGGYISDNEKNLNLNNPQSSSLLKDNNQYIINNYPNIFKELYRWDQRFFALVLTNKPEEFPSYKILEKICKNIGGKIITLENGNLLSDKLTELNKSFQNVGALINFNINKSRKKNIITFIEYNGKIEEMNEKWLFPDELIITKENKFLPVKNAIPIYELGNIKYNFQLSQECYDKYEIKDKQFIFNILIEADCWNNLSIQDFLKEYKTSITIDILISGLNNTKILKKPFAVLNLIFSKEIINQMSESLNNRGNMSLNKFFLNFQNNYQSTISNMIKSGQKINTEFNSIKCEFLNLPYHYAELISLIQNYKYKKINEIDFNIDIENYCMSIPFYYIKKVIKFLEKNKIKQFLEKEKESYKKFVNQNFSNELINEIELLFKVESDNINKINKALEDNKNLIMKKRGTSYFRDLLSEKNHKQNIINRQTEKEEDEEYSDFINKAFRIDEISNMTSMNNLNINNNFLEKTGYNNILMNNNSNIHEVDIDLMGANREQLFRNDHLRSYLIPEIELRYLIKDYLFGNQFIQRKYAYTKQGASSSFPNNDSIFLYINDEDNNILYKSDPNINLNSNINNKAINNNKNINLEIPSEHNNKNKKIISNKNKEKEKDKNNSNYLINNKRNREENSDNLSSPKKLNESFNTDNSSNNDEPPEPMIFNDNYSESDGSNNLMLDELPDSKIAKSKMTNSLIEEFKNSLNEVQIENGIKISAKFDISKEKLNKWKFQKKIKNFSQDLINSIHNDESNIIKIINQIIDQKYYSPDKKMTYHFIEKVLKICKDFGVNQMVQTQLQNLMKCYS